uniref:Tetraspanin-7 n=1 Tax=Schistocephalus solidus TaxID=70667 RepID=A0A0X3PJR5_SCHSO
MCCVISAALKFIVTIVNLVLGLAFVALAIVGILLKTSSGFIQSIVRKIFDSAQDKLSSEEVDTIVKFIGENSTGISAICIVVGSVLAVLCFIGFFASCCGCTCLLKIYAILLCVLLVAQIIFVAVIFSDKEKYGNYVVLAMEQLLKEYNPATDKGKSAAVLWDLTMQLNGLCCGLDGAGDFSGTPYNPNAPSVCCGNTTTLAPGCTIAAATALPSPVVGCRTKILDFAVKNMEMVMYIFIAAILLQGLLLALVIGAIYVQKVSPV